MKKEFSFSEFFYMFAVGVNTNQAPRERMSDIKTIYEDLKTYAPLIARAGLMLVDPRKDEITQRQAYKEYGTTFVKDAVRLLGVSSKKVGNRKFYSSFELEAARAAGLKGRSAGFSRKG